MYSKYNQYRIKLIAKAIAEDAETLEEVVFNQTTFVKIASTAKLKNDNNMRKKIRYLWNITNSQLKSTVLNILKEKKGLQNQIDEVRFNSKNNVLTDKSKNNTSEITSKKDYECHNYFENEKGIIYDGENSYNIKDVKSDGNCLFRCFSYYLYGTEESHVTIRNKIVDFTVQYWSEEWDYLRSTCVEKIYKNAEEYKNTMGKISTYGTDYEIRVFVKVYKISVTVFNKTDDGKVLRLQTLESDNNNNNDNDMHLRIMFSGDERQGHWLLLEPQNTKENVLIKNDGEKLQNSKFLTKNVNNINKISNILIEEEVSVNEISEYREKEILSKDTCNKNKDPFEFKVNNNEDSDLNASIFDKKSESLTLYNSENDSNSSQQSNESFFDKNEDNYKKSPPTFTVDIATLDSENDSDSSQTSNEPQTLYNSENDSNSSQQSNESFFDKNEDNYKKSPPTFTVDIATLDVKSNNFKSDYGELNENKIRTTIEKIMLYTLHCTCTLRFYGSVRFNQQDVVCYAKCRKVHNQKFRFTIDHTEDPVARLTITSDNELKVVHDETSGPPVFRTLKGEERKKWAKELKHRRVVDFLGEIQKNTRIDLKYDGHMQDLRTFDTAYKVKSAERCQLRLSLQSYDLSDLMQMWIVEQKLKDPFLRYVALPLTVIMYREADLCTTIGQKPLILHMDATGSVVRKPQDLKCKRIFYYCVLFKAKNEIVKLTQMITSEHTVVSISIFLKQYKYFVLEKLKKWPLAQVITIDWSWAFIHSVSQEWNSISIKKYLQIMFQYCNNNIIPSRELTILKICYAHFMHIVARALEKKFSEYKNFKCLLLECIALICLCRNLKQMDELFKHVCTLLLSKDERKVSDSVTVITNLSKKNSEKINDYESVENLPDDEFEIILNEEEENDTIYRSSPFFQKYAVKLALLKQELEINDDYDDDDDDEKEASNVSNKYYAPKFVQHLVTKWMPYVVLWSSLDLDLIDPKISRITNAFVESSHRITKEIDFKGISNRSIADRVRELQTSAEGILANLELDAPLKSKLSRQKPKYPVTEPNPTLEETWKKEKHGRRKKGHCHIKTLKKIQENFEIEAEENKNKKFSNIIDDKNEKKLDDKLLKSRKRKVKYNNKNALKKRAIVSEESKLEQNKKKEEKKIVIEDVKYTNENEDNKIDYEFKVLEEAIINNTVKKIDKFYNGLVRDIDYYMISKSSVLSIVRCSIENSLSLNIFELSAREFSTLRDRIWIDGQVIDSFAAVSIDEWIDVTYVPTDDTATILGEFSNKRLNRNKSICKTKKPMKNNLFLPYQYESHWRLMIANIKEKKLMLLDPYKNETDRFRVIEAFKNFIQYCWSASSFSSLRGVTWSDIEILERPYQPNNDGYSCGPYVMYYMDCIGKQIPFEKTFNPSTYRREIAYNLLLKSENMEDTCLYCFAKIKSQFIKCKVCERKSHTECLYKSEMNTDEEEYVIKKKTKMIKSVSDSITKIFICKLCKKYKNGYYTT